MASSQEAARERFFARLRVLYQAAGEPNLSLVAGRASPQKISAWMNETVPRKYEEFSPLLIELIKRAKRRNSPELQPGLYSFRMWHDLWNGARQAKSGRRNSIAEDADAASEAAFNDGTSTKFPLTAERWDAVPLGVHRAMDDDPTLPVDATNRLVDRSDEPVPYVMRQHDWEMREILEQIAARRTRKLIVALGRPYTGKTRTCYEAVHATPIRGWPLHRAESAEEILEFLEADLPTECVLWLGDLAFLFEGHVGEQAALALVRLLASPMSPTAISVIGEMARDDWLAVTRQRRQHLGPSGTANESRSACDLLARLALKVNVPDDFSDASEAELVELDNAASRDRRLAVARDSSGPSRRVVQALAGGPWLREYYLTMLRPFEKAIWTAAMDAHRIGFRSPFTPQMLEEAASGYLAPASPDALDFDAALSAAREESYGVCALEPVRAASGYGQFDSFRLHGYLAQHAVSARRREPVAPSTWLACIKYAKDDADMARLARSAQVRGMRSFVQQLSFGVSMWTSGSATVEQFMAQVAVDVLSDFQDTYVFASRRDADQLTELTTDELRVLSDRGNASAAAVLARRLSQLDYESATRELRWEVMAGNTEAATKELIQLYCRHSVELERQVLTYGLDVDGYPAER